MGSIVKAMCSQCGYRSGELFLGGGMLNFRNVCKFPALDLESNEIVAKNYYEKESEENSGVIFYDSKELIETEYKEEKKASEKTPLKILKNLFKTKQAVQRNRRYVMQNFDVYLYDENYLCPKCKNFSLRFFMTGLWD